MREIPSIIKSHLGGKRVKRGSEIEQPKGKENFPRKLIIKSAWSEVKAAGRRGVLWIKLQQRLVPECLAYRREICYQPNTDNQALPCQTAFVMSLRREI